MSTAPPTQAAPVPGGSDAGGTRPRIQKIGVTIICVVAGLLFGTSASLARTSVPTTGAQDLPGLITARDQQVKTLADRAEELRLEVQALEQGAGDSAVQQASRVAERLAPSVGLAPVTGAAVQVTLDDAGYSLDTLPPDLTVDDVVVHQQDLQAVVNALWAGGAEALMVQDQRIVSTSAVQCVGNTLYLQGRVYSPPYTITAIGDPATMHAALLNDPVVETYRQWAAAIGLGYVVQDIAQVEMPAFAGGVPMRYATVTTPAKPSEVPTTQG
ncbi:MAG: DUF881 domain-containing protein [Ornithinimicrobium sp.]|uniref:DUF881 domain-containing protein n=1 Tax=Ornithinimicrobium sp. TaxID=1977084 RepID=UPI0026E08842|nr:DUF881 domain-containing protein [Ornithinimicrobium sp.]MDO5739188.1 DUF881 domain-containing protein [Ornithinimicrobium sp.]